MITDLIKHELIQKKDKKRLQKILKRIEEYEGTKESSNLTYLSALGALSIEKVTGQKFENISTMILGRVSRLDGYETLEVFGESNQEKLLSQHEQYLQRLHNCKLITAVHVEQFMPKIRMDSLYFPFQLVPRIIGQIKKEDRLSWERLNKPVTYLLKADMISASEQQRLKSDIEENKIGNQIELLKYLNRAVLIDLTTFSDEPDDYLEQVHRMTASVLDELSFDTFEYEIITETLPYDTSRISYRLLATITHREQQYQQVSFYSPMSERAGNSKMGSFGKIGYRNYYRIFNKILAEIESPYRLHSVRKSENNTLDYDQFAIIALTEEQVKIIREKAGIVSISYEQFINITSKKIKNAIQAYNGIGLFSHLTDEQIQTGKAKVSTQEIRSFNDILSSFPDVIFYFDVEMGNLDNPYEEIIESCARISRGKFTPKNIRGNFQYAEEGRCTIEFDFKGKHYSKELEVNGDWVDGYIFDFLREVLVQNGIDGSFCYLMDVGEIFLTDAQHKYLTQNELISFPEY
ncbi:MAG: hypothetical protein AAGI23_09655 [Bacteroidota bacterium]